jgi:hypothetical protein
MLWATTTMRWSAVAFYQEAFAVNVNTKASIWARLGVVWQLKPISPSYGKARRDRGFRIREMDG